MEFVTQKLLVNTFEMTVIFRAHVRLVSTYFLNLPLLLPAALEELIHEVTFLLRFDSTIISFCFKIEHFASMMQNWA